MHSLRTLAKKMSTGPTSRCQCANNFFFFRSFSTRKPKKQHKPRYYYLDLDMEPEKSLHPPSPPQETSKPHVQTGDEKVENLPETKKSKMKLIVTRAELDNIKENRKLRISDLIRIAPKTQLEFGKLFFNLRSYKTGLIFENYYINRPRVIKFINTDYFEFLFIFWMRTPQE